MALLILEECINCAACGDECPNDAISSAEIYVIDPARCTECVGFEEKPKCVDVCPVECIVVDPAHVEDLAALRAKYQAQHGEPAPEIGQGFAGR